MTTKARTGGPMYGFPPPIGDIRFWWTQVLVVSIAAIHVALEGLGVWPDTGGLYFVPVSLFFVPVVYAALSFGLAGSLPTALWCVVLVVPNWIFWHPGMERHGETIQLGIIVAMAIFVGHRVDQERRARSAAEAASRALEVSERKYRGLFEAAREGILVLDKEGRVVDSNAAAGALLPDWSGGPADALVAKLLPQATAAQTVSAAAQAREGPAPEPVRLKGADGADIWVEPAFTPISEEEGLTQVVLRNVTDQKRRQEGLQAYAAQILRAQEEERQRIAQELHDETVQSLIVLYRQLDSIEGLGGDLSDPALAELREARVAAEGIVASLRGFIRGLRPPILDDLGLTPAIRRLVTELTARTSIHGDVSVRGRLRRLAPDAELALFRIAQEALRNVERHSNASHVRVHVLYRPHGTELDIVDDGCGFAMPGDPNEMASENKLGLIGMHERARIVGGNLSIRSVLGAGTEVTASVPVGQGVFEPAARRQHAGGNGLH